MRCGLLQSVIPAFVSQSVMWAGYFNTAEQIDILSGVKTLVEPRNIVLDLVPLLHDPLNLRSLI